MIVLLLLAPLWDLARLLLVVEGIAYGLVLAAGALPAAVRQRDPRLVLALPLAILSMHCCWGAGFLWSMVTTSRK